MTEEIIIDGVNVAGCDFFAKEDLYNSYSGETQAYKGECGCSDDTMCKDIKNCCYKKQGKQLKRLEQENKVLNFKINQLKANSLYNDLTGIELSAKVVELEQENKELKAYKDVNEDFKTAWDELNEKHKRCRSALEEIRKIIRADCKRCTAECDCEDDCTRHKIKNKINEVLK